MSLQAPNPYNPPPVYSPAQDATVYGLLALFGGGLMIAFGMAGLIALIVVVLVAADILPKLRGHHKYDS